MTSNERDSYLRQLSQTCPCPRLLLRAGIIQKSRALREYAAANITTAVDMVEGEAAEAAAGGGKAGAGAAAPDKGGGSGKGKGDTQQGEGEEDEDGGTGAYGTAFKDIAAEETEKEVQEFEVKEDKVGRGGVCVCLFACVTVGRRLSANVQNITLVQTQAPTHSRPALFPTLPSLYPPLPSASPTRCSLSPSPPLPPLSLLNTSLQPSPLSPLSPPLALPRPPCLPPPLPPSVSLRDWFKINPPPPPVPAYAFTS